ncbi:glycosyltransferase [Mycobacterium ulcerans]
MTDEMDRAYLRRPVGDPAPLPADRSLAVLIVIENGHDPVQSCLHSVAEQLPGLPVYVYDNNAQGYPGRQELAAGHPAVHWISGPADVGFAAACNALARQSPGDSDLLLLKADARLRGPLTRTRQLLRQPGVAAVSPLVRDEAAPDRPPWDIATQRLTLVRGVVEATGLSSSLRATPISPIYPQRPRESQSFSGYLKATCLAISRAAWNAVGGFDEEYFSHGAPADWQARARAAGWRVLLADELGAQQGGAPPTGAETGPTVTAGERRRTRDVIRANDALLLEHQCSVHHADAYLATTKVLQRLRRAQRRAIRNTDAGKRRPAIVIATNRLVYGGAERQKALLAAELDRRGYPVTIVCVQRFGPLIKEIPDTVRVVRQPWWAPIVDVGPGPAVLISGDTNTETGFATLWRAAGRRRRWLVAAHIPPLEDGPIYSRPLTAAMRRADGFIVLAQLHWDMLTPYHRLGGPRFVAPNGVAVTDRPAGRSRPAGAPPHLVMLSRIVEHKNPHQLIEALSGITELPWTLSIFGDGPDRERLQARTPERLRDRVHWRGWSPGPGPALADADLLCVPSRSEAFPLVILEAMARAVPVAASAICAVPEMLDFGGAGFVVEPVTVSAWQERLAQILADPGGLPAVGQRGFARMRKHYTVAAMTDAYLDAIHAVL